EILEKILAKMEIEKGNWVIDLNKRKDNLNEIAKRQFLREINSFELEIKRFSKGIEIIKNFDWVRRSFNLMNETFFKCSESFSAWKLYQIVFIVSVIPDIVVGEYGEDDIGDTQID